MKKKGFSYAKWGYIFAAPFIIAFALFMLYPVIYTLIIGFTDMKGMAPGSVHILDDLFGNFKDVLSDPLFKKSLANTFIMWMLNFIPQIVLALVLAAWFTNERMKLKGKGFFKVVFYMPNIITAATVAMLFYSLFSYPKGPINDILLSLGAIDTAYNFAVDATAARLTVAFIQFWMWYGYTMIVLISGILGISPDIFEAADIDGANGFQKFIYVTLPNLKTIMLFTLVTSMIGGLQMFDIPKLYLDGGPNDATRTAQIYIYKKAFSGAYMYNSAAAASMIMFLIIAVFAGVIFFMLRDKDEAAMHKQIRQQEKAYKAKLKAQKEGK